MGMPIRDDNAWTTAIELGRRVLGGSRYDPRKIQILGLSPRQQELGWKLSWLHGQQYATYQYEWDGSRALDLQMVWTAPQDVPPGFIDMTGSDYPLRARRPIAPYQIAQQVFSQFTSMLFGEDTHPRVQVFGDPEGDDFCQGLIEGARLWSRMGEARDYGGACGAVAMSFRFHQGEPRIEVHNPVWANPTFLEGREDLYELSALELRWQVPLEVKLPGRDQSRDPYRTLYAWRRRVIDAESDTTFHLVWCGDEVREPVRVNGELVFPSGGEEPDWSDPQLVKLQIQHGLGECPAVWIPNLAAVDGEPYGKGDIDGNHALIREIDELNSAATFGIRANCDPSVVFEGTNQIPDGIKKGSNYPMAVPQGSVKYLEMTGSGTTAAAERVREIRQNFLDSVECVLTTQTPEGGKPMTATEVIQQWGPMLRKVARLREQYGEYGVKPLLRKMLRAAVLLSSRGTRVVVPPKQVKLRGEPDTFEPRLVPTALPDSIYLHLQWPRPIKPTLAEISQAVTAIVAVKQASLIDLDSAVRFLAQFFEIENVDAVIDELEAQQMEAQLAGQDLDGPDEDGESEPPGTPG